MGGVRAQDINSWGEMKQVLRELKKPEVQAVYKSIIIDTVDIASDMCQKYICNQLGIENIGDGGWSTNGWAKYKKEFEETFRTLTQLGYAVLFISHDKEKTIKSQYGQEYQQICSSVQSSALSIIENMSDIIGYVRMVPNDNGFMDRVLTLRSPDGSVRCGSRFKYMEHEIPFSFQSLTKALNDAIDREAAENNNMYVTSERNQSTIQTVEYDFDNLQEEFKTLVGNLMSVNQSNSLKITAIVEKSLGKGKKFADCTPSQCEQMDFIVSELRELVKTL